LPKLLQLLPAVLAALLLFASITPSAEAQGRVKIALLPIVVHSSEDPSYLRSGLSDMLVSRLDQAGLFDVQRIEDPSRATTSLEQAIKLGAATGAEFVLFGSFTRFGQGASLDMQCVSTRVTGATPLREIFVHSGSIGDVIPDLDELVGKVSRFAVADYDDRAAVSAAAPATAKARPSEAKLRRRVETLEREMRELKRRSDDFEKERAAARQQAAQGR